MVIELTGATVLFNRCYSNRHENWPYRLDCAYLFGSHAKGTSNQWSDIDLAIVSPDFSEDLYEERLVLMRLAAEIDDRIEPKPFRPEMFTPIEPLVDEIQKHGLKLI